MSSHSNFVSRRYREETEGKLGYFECNLTETIHQEVELRRKSMEASTLEKLAEKEKKAAEVRAKKASMPPQTSEEKSE